MEKQAELRREFMILNARIRDLKKMEEEMNNIEVLQVYYAVEVGFTFVLRHLETKMVYQNIP